MRQKFLRDACILWFQIILFSKMQHFSAFFRNRKIFWTPNSFFELKRYFKFSKYLDRNSIWEVLNFSWILWNSGTIWFQINSNSIYPMELIGFLNCGTPQFPSPPQKRLLQTRNGTRCGPKRPQRTGPANVPKVIHHLICHAAWEQSNGCVRATFRPFITGAGLSGCCWWLPFVYIYT